MNKDSLDFNNPDFVKYTKNLGVTGHHSKPVSDFIHELETALQMEGVHLINLAVDYSLNHEILNIY